MARSPTFTAIEKWVDKSEIDYMTYFIKTWIPFNAWYNRNLDDNLSDRQKIEKIKADSSNTFHRAILDILENRAGSQTSDEFRGYIGSLHNQLESLQISYDFRPGETDILSFTRCLKSRNSETRVNETYNGIRYFIERTDSQAYGHVSEVKILITNRSGTTTFNYTHGEYDKDHANSEMISASVNRNQIDQALSYFDQLKPIIINSALQDSSKFDSPDHYYDCGVYKFVRVAENTNPGFFITASLIEVLYQLRNLLFHGQISPSPETQPLYQNAYLIMRMLIQKLD